MLSPGLQNQAPANAGTESTYWPRQSLDTTRNTRSSEIRKTNEEASLMKYSVVGVFEEYCAVWS